MITSTHSRPWRQTAAAIATGLLGLAAVPAGAAPISYAESSGGDLPAVPTSLGLLDVGTNVITGFWSGTPVQPADLNTDSFVVELAAGLRIDSISIAYTLDRGEETNVAATLQSPFTSILSSAGTSGPQTVAGLYEVNLSGSVMFNPTDWRVTYNVSRVDTGGGPGNPVPLPGSLALMLPALLGLAALRRR